MENATTGPDSLVEVLSRTPPFRTLNEESLRKVAGIAKTEQHPAGHRLFSLGDAGDRLYIVMEGKVRVGRDIAGLGEEALAMMGPGTSFGELSLIDAGPRSADAIVHESCTLLSISHRAFEELLLLNQQIACEILWEFCRVLAGRLRETDDKFAMLEFAAKF